MAHLDALFDPEVSGHGLPVLRADDVQQTIVEPPANACVKHFHELLSNVWLRATESTEERRLQL